MLDRAVRSDAMIYTISTADLDTGVGNERLLRRLADGSGGLSYSPRSEADVVSAFREIATNIHRGYSIGYVPTNNSTDGRYRKVKVSVQAPGGNSLRVRTRDGYLAARAPDVQ
jgi:VWFA-related protein